MMKTARIVTCAALTVTSLMAAAAEPAKTVKVFILAGQSNMVGHGKVEVGRNPAWTKEAKDVPREIKGGGGCLRHLATAPETAGTYGKFLGADGKWVERDDVFIYTVADSKQKKGKLSVGHGKGTWFGPELGFGWQVGDALDEPVLLIKTSWGGKDLAVDFRPPSSGDTSLGNGRPVGEYYSKMLDIVKEVCGNLDTHFPELKGYKPEIAGFGWHQGWNDGCSVQMVDEYEQNMANFIRDVRKALGVENLPFVIANTGMIGWEAKGHRAKLCEIQLGMADPKKHPEFAGTVASVETRDFKKPNEQAISSFGYHWNHDGESHYHVGDTMGKAMVNLLGK